MSCERTQEALALALLGKADLDASTMKHVENCPACAAEQARLRPVVALLSRVEAADVVAVEEPIGDDRMLARLLDRVAIERRRQRRRVMFALAAAVVAVAAIGLGSLLHQGPTTILASASAQGIQASAKIDSTSTGSTIALTVRGVPRGITCRLQAIDRDGNRQTIVTWVADYRGAATALGTTRFDPADIVRITVRRVGGPVLLVIPVQA